MKSHIPYFIILISICTFGASCSLHGSSRTSLEKWTNQTFEYIGITLDLPKDALGVKTTGTIEDGELQFDLHKYGLGIADSYFPIKVRLLRMDASHYKSFRDGTHFESSYWVWNEHHSLEYTNATHFIWNDFNHGELYGWRQDYFADNGDVIVAGVSYGPLEGWSDEIRVADSNAVERVLRSIRFSNMIK